MRSLLATGTLLVLLLACGEPSLRDVPAADRPPTQALAGIPVPPTAAAVSTNGMGNSIEISLIEAMSPDSVAEYYRVNLLALGWDLRVDSRLPDGGVSLHAVLGDRPVWVMIYPRRPSGSRFNVIAGVRDSTTR